MGSENNTAQPSYAELVATVTQTNKRIIDHMQQEERDRAAEYAKLNEKLRPLEDLVNSLPRDEHGHPSTYVHRRHHEVIARAGGHAKAFGSSMWGKAGEMVMIALVVVIANGSLKEFLLHLFK